MNPLNRIGRWTLSAIAAWVLTTAGGTVQAASEATVERMDPAALEQMFNDPDSGRLIIAMASWCAPCRKELPLLNELYRKYQDQGLKLVGVSLDLEGPAAMQAIVRKLKVEFPVYWVGEGAVKKYEIYAVPMLYVVRDGKVVEKIPGKRSKAFLEKRIRKLLE